LSALTDGEYDAFSPGTTDAMIPDHARKRLDAFLKVLKNAGLAEAGIARVHDLAVAYETDRGGPPLSQDEVLSWIKTRTFASEREQRGAEAFLGAYLVFNSPSSGADVSSLIQGLLSLEADTVIKAAHDALEGEGPLGRIATRTMSFLTRETVRQWLAPIGAIALVVLAFLENPAFIFMRMVHPTPTKASRELDMSDAAVKSARLEAELARDLMRAVEKRWKGGAPRSLDDLTALSASPSEFGPIAAAYELDIALWPRNSKSAASEIVLRGKAESKRIILAGPDAVTVIDPAFVITTEGYR
jgi:hypothetical protein